MKLIELVILTGIHCASPVEQTPLMTSAAKVNCAVVVYGDTETKVLRVVPETKANVPLVITALQRLRATMGLPPGPEKSIETATNHSSQVNTQTVQPDISKAAEWSSRDSSLQSNPQPMPVNHPSSISVTKDSETVADAGLRPQLTIVAVPPNAMAPTIERGDEIKGQQSEAPHFDSQTQFAATTSATILPTANPPPNGLVEVPSIQKVPVVDRELPGSTEQPGQAAHQPIMPTMSAANPRTAMREPTQRAAKSTDRSKPAAKQRNAKCRGSSKAVWYTNKNGQRKFRCSRQKSLY